ncbi:MAG: chromate efflux transporter [Desulfarculus sp.]|nr:chromate efflux transporter [Desulfarculus sp.]
MTAHAAQVPARVLFLCFLRLGLTAFGGPAMVAFLRRVAVEQRGWLSPREFQDGVALCQSIPGATVMQLAAYIGLRVGGPLGSLAAFAAFALPAFGLMLGLSVLYAQTRQVPAAGVVALGLRAMVVALMAAAALDFTKKTIKGWPDGLLAASAGLLILAGGNPILAIAGASLAGLALYRGGAAPEPDSPPLAEAQAAFPGGALLVLGGLVLGWGALRLLDERLADLALLMAKVDLFAMGGGLASVPLMYHEVVQARSWLPGPAFLDGIALGQVTPGPIVITATFIGYLLAGWAGVVVGTVAVFSPSLVILWLVYPRFQRLRRNPSFQRLLRGSLASFVGLLAAMALRFAWALDWSWPTALLSLAALTALVLKVDILWVVTAGALVSLLASWL